jgi:dihydroorotate dehydrogenase electron transfer subunit
MNTKLKMSCIDINSPYCPCLLAETNDCIFCSHLRGGAVCDCNWGGICILYEKQWQPKPTLAGGQADLPARREYESAFSRRELIAASTYLLEFPVDQELAAELKKPGAFVFLRRPEDPQYFHFPVGVMKVSGENVQVAVEGVGPKTNRLLAAENSDIIVRGPYYNGILGQPWIDNITYGTILIVAGGMGQPPAVPIAARLVENRNSVHALLAPGQVGRVFIDEELRQMGVNVDLVDSLRRSGYARLSDWLADKGRRIDLVVSAGPDDQHHGVIAAMQAAGVNVPMAATNNSTMCCGEGICGSCECETENHRRIRLCKTQTDFTALIT